MNRIHRLLKKLAKKDFDGMLFIGRSNITYLTGFTGEASRLIVSKNGCVLITDGRYTEQAGEEVHDDIQVFKWIKDNRYGAESYEKFVKEFGIKKLAFEGETMTFGDYLLLKKGLSCELVPTQDFVEKQRQVKDHREIEAIKEACRVSDRALQLTLPMIREGTTEKVLAAHLEFNMKMHGADDISFETIALSGKRTSLLHGRPEDNLLQHGDLVQLDFGALYKGYHADMSRAFIVGKASDRQHEFYAMMQAAEADAIAAIQPGVTGHEVDEAARAAVSSEYIENYYPGIGHGVGLDIHEQPFIKQNTKFTFQPGMVVTIEPGVYVPGWGGMRIEDTVLVTEDGAEMLTNFPRDLMEV